MSIVCGTDFSEPSQRAARVAARLAAKASVPLHLAHAVPLEWTEAKAEAASRLQSLADQCRALGASVAVHVPAGPPEDALLSVVSAAGATWIVMGAQGEGEGRAAHSGLGAHADRLVQRSHVPALIVRNEEPFSAWVEGTRPLRVLAGVDFSASTDALVAWLSGLSKLGPTEITAAHLYLPPEEFRRLGLSGLRSFVEPDRDVTAVLQRDLESRFAGGFPPGTLTYHLEPHIGRVADRLLQLASEREADLVVVGTQSRDALSRVWHGSVSHCVLKSAKASVVCVPSGLTEGDTVQPPRLRVALVATDFSAAGNAAIPFAYSVVRQRGTVHLVHVAERPTPDPFTPHDIFKLDGEAEDPVRRDAAEKLRALVPPGVERDGIETRIHVLRSNYPAEAISQAAERLGADVICLGTLGRTGAVRALLGSVAQSVLGATRRPVLLVH